MTENPAGIPLSRAGAERVAEVPNDPAPMTSKAMPAPMASPAVPGESRLGRLLERPIVGLSPWIAMAALASETPFEIAAAAGLGVTIVIVALSAVDGSPPKLLEFADLAFFGGLTLLAAIAGHAVSFVLERWAEVISAGSLALIGLATLLARRPFTMQYARQRVAREQWGTTTFRHANVVLTWVWTGAFALTALGALAGQAVTGQAGSFWLGWTVKSAALVVALQLTWWYPAVLRARERRAAGLAFAPPPSVRELLLPVPPYLITLGILAVVLDSAPIAIGLGLVVAGLLTAATLASRRDTPR